MTVVGSLVMLGLTAKAVVLCPAQPTNPPHHKPTAEAARANAKGLKLYLAKDFAGAVRAYRRAMQLDPLFLTPRLNAASALAQQEKFDAAAQEAAALLQQAYMPWARAINEATDLLVFRDGPQQEAINRVAVGAAKAWGRAAVGGLVHVARVGTPMSSGTGRKGTFLWVPKQELFSWDPSTGRNYQLTAEDGRIVGFDRSADGKRLIYARAEKLVRGEGPPKLRGVTVRVLDLPTMRFGSPVPVPGDHSQLALSFRSTPQVHTDTDVFVLKNTTLIPTKGNFARLIFGKTAGQKGPRKPDQGSFGKQKCRFKFREKTVTGIPGIEVLSPGGDRFMLNAPQGAGLFSIPIE